MEQCFPNTFAVHERGGRVQDVSQSSFSRCKRCWGCLLTQVSFPFVPLCLQVCYFGVLLGVVVLLCFLHRDIEQKKASIITLKESECNLPALTPPNPTQVRSIGFQIVWSKCLLCSGGGETVMFFCAWLLHSITRPKKNVCMCLWIIQFWDNDCIVINRWMRRENWSRGHIVRQWNTLRSLKPTKQVPAQSTTLWTGQLNELLLPGISLHFWIFTMKHVPFWFPLIDLPSNTKAKSSFLTLTLVLECTQRLKAEDVMLTLPWWELKGKYKQVDCFPCIINWSTEMFVCFQFTDHILYNASNVLRDLASDTVFFTSVRDPTTQVVSSFHFFYPNETDATDVERMLETPWVKQGMSSVFVPKQYDRIKAEKYIKERLDSFFSFVLITEYFDESLVLLKRKFCWDLEDIIYIPQKVYSKKKRKLNAMEAERIRNSHVRHSLVHKFQM